ncbi:hypothetical protein PW52_07930 [Tamlana sedimentorum]|uniref:DUF4221 domain-containing protein n=1 Tax=Neotamlana sedimentorum TaxID=1435349 RepID=A0A0D7W953_9FLAO|nr:hypothetical protein PW52_07930 [Tamlana sedimentorum]
MVFNCNNSDVLNNINPKQGILKASSTLKAIKTKQFILDSYSAPNPQYIQIVQDTAEVKYLSFLNTYNNAIYLYDYTSLTFVKKIIYERKGGDGILEPLGYYIKTLDSIYVYDKPTTSLILANSQGHILERMSLKTNLDIRDTDWTLKFPQYRSHTAMPIMLTPKELLFTGQFIGSVPEEIVPHFKFTAHLNLKTKQVNFTHGYPKELYGSGFNWKGGMYTQVFPELHPDGDKLIYSFPVSHNLYIADLKSENYTTVYGGSNVIYDIASIDETPKKTSPQQFLTHIIEEDQYLGIRYDKYRKVYYRFFALGANAKTLDKKNIGVIIMDKEFKYLGETVFGNWKNWNYNNVFVTEEGLNIEYLDDNHDEGNLTIKVFAIKPL